MPVAQATVGRRATAVWAIGFLGAALLGALVGVATFFLVSGTVRRDGWEDLVGAVAALVLGLGAAGLAWLALLAFVVARFVPRGRRVAVLMIAVGAVAATLAAAWGVVALIGGTGGALNWVVVGAVALAAAVAPPVLVATVGRPPGPAGSAARRGAGFAR